MNMKKFVSLVLAMVMMMAMMVPAMAATITVNSADNVSVAGKTLKAYKILDLQLIGEGYVYTVPESLKSFYATEFGLDVNSGDFDYEVVQKIAEMESNSDDLFTFVAKALAAAKTAGVTPASATGAEGATEVEFTDLELGYYVIEDEGTTTPISALMLDSTNPDMEVTLKADKPTIEKKIDGDIDTDENTDGMVDYNNTAIGDEVPYELTSKVPDMTGYEKYFFVVTDKLSKGLTFNDDIAITVGEKTLVKDTDYTVSTTEDTDGTTVKIVFNNFIQYKDQKGAEIKITYSATVNENAVIGTAGNPNSVELTYSNNPNVESDGENEPDDDDPVGVTPKDDTYTYVTEIEINKVDPQGNTLAGAEFELTGEKLNKVIVVKEVFSEDANGEYYQLKNGTYTKDEPTDETKDQYASEKKYAVEEVKEVITTSETVTVKATTGADGKIVFSGLSAGEYTITEIKAPAGYNLLDEPITLTITFTEPATGSTECTWSYSWSNGDNDYSIQIVNQTGTELPSTGGMGTTMMYIAGGLLVAAAVVLLLAKRRANAAE